MQKIRMTAVLGLCALSALLCIQAPALAADARELGQFGKWKALSFDDGSKGKVCFMSAAPDKQEGKFTKRGEVAFFITHWAADQTRDVVSVAIGYPFKKGSSLRVTIDGREYKMATDGEMAWAADSATDRTISEAIRRGSKLVIKGVSARGTETTDTYSLTGSGDAYNKITEACGL
jgi:hypothetical protein